MSLISRAMEDVVILEKRSESDGEDGFIVEWEEGAVFKAAITFDTSIESRVAEVQGVKSRYTITTSKNAKLEYHDVVKRLSDGKIFRITSDGDDKQTPSVASFQFLQVTAEEYKI